ncbi:MAG: tol-pal system protein YbgF [Syntrophales bacterium]
MNNLLLVIMIFCSLSYTGCATTMDLEKTERKFDTEIGALHEENAAIAKATAKNDQAITDIRKRIADVAADITEIREELENVRGDREVLGKGESDIRKEFADIKNQYEQLSSRIKTMENLLEIGGSVGQAPTGDKAMSDDSKSAVPGETEKKLAYDSAYEAFKEEKYEKAREGFQTFLKQYPNTEYSDSAQFWIGESYYFERNYEQAILEYEKVIKNYPQGNKTPNALLKQGFAFLNIGDKSSAKLLLEQVAKNYPGTSQARMARAKLAEIK